MWGTDFNTNIFIKRKKFNNKSDVISHLEEINDSIISYESAIKMFVSSNPRDIIPLDWSEQPIDWLGSTINEKFEEYKELIVERCFINLYIEYLDENNIEIIESTNE